MDDKVSQENFWREFGEFLRELHRSWPKDPVTGKNRMPWEYHPGAAALHAADEHQFDRQVFVRFCREWLGTEEPEHVEAVMEVVTRVAKKPFDANSWIYEPERCIRYLRRVAGLEKQRIARERDATPKEEDATDPADEVFLGHATKNPARGRKLKTSALSPHYASVLGILEDLSRTGTLRDQRFANHILKDGWEIRDLSLAYDKSLARDFKRKLERRLKKFSEISEKSS